MYKLLESGDILIELDEYYSSNEWKMIPMSWVGKILNYENNHTIANLQIPFRRLVEEDSDG